MNSVQCLITGCEFLDPITQRYIRGDLHQLFDTLIVNASGCEWVDAVTTPLSADSKAVLCADFYEKNGQIVFPLQLAQFNLAANIYLNKAMDEAKELAKAQRAIRGAINGHKH